MPGLARRLSFWSVTRGEWVGESRMVSSVRIVVPGNPSSIYRVPCMRASQGYYLARRYLGPAQQSGPFPYGHRTLSLHFHLQQTFLSSRSFSIFLAHYHSVLSAEQGHLAYSHQRFPGCWNLSRRAERHTCIGASTPIDVTFINFHRPKDDQVLESGRVPRDLYHTLLSIQLLFFQYISQLDCVVIRNDHTRG